MDTESSCGPVDDSQAPDPFTLFKELLQNRPHGNATDEETRKAFDLVMAGKHGLHLRLIGTFWVPEGAEGSLIRFMDFVETHRIPVRTTWQPRWPGGPFGVEYRLAPLEECSLEWTGNTARLADMKRKAGSIENKHDAELFRWFFSSPSGKVMLFIRGCSEFDSIEQWRKAMRDLIEEGYLTSPALITDPDFGKRP